MKKTILSFGIALALCFGSVQTAKADEGMWLPFLVNKYHAQMKQAGFKLSAEDVYSINKACMKDGVIQLGGFCSGEVISNEGLFLTNHHCAHDAIQGFSSVEHDYLKDGFWAKNRKEEKNVPGLTASFLVRVEDVSAKVQDAVKGLSEADRKKKIKELLPKLEAEATKETAYKAGVESFFGGNEYYLFVYEVYGDVRLVCAPPESVGNFGNETDNWMWPRHTGDFTMLRIYTGKDNKATEYADSNVPYKPKYHFPISLDGVKEGDYAMVMGYPGSTDRYMTSQGVKAQMEVKGPNTVKIRDSKLKTMRAYMAKSDAIRIQYSSKMNNTSNYWKYFIGQTEQLKHNKVIGKKEKIEKEFNDWVSSKNKNEYKGIVDKINATENANRDNMKLDTYFNEAIFQGAEIIMQGYQNMSFAMGAMALDKNSEDYKKAVEEHKAGIKKYFKDYYLPVDKEIMTNMLTMYSEEISKSQQPAILQKAISEGDKGIANYVDALYTNSIFASEDKTIAWVDNMSQDVLEKDPAILLVNEFIVIYRGMMGENRKNTQEIEASSRVFIKGLREMQPTKSFYPDANFTMRLTYGNVKSYVPRDGAFYKENTTLKGVMEKEDPTNPEFVVAPKLKQLYDNKEYGIYADKGKELSTCFITTNDITGGNSGSGVFNGDGRLIGCAFDGNWESMSGDIFYEKEIQRTICADIRYVLFVVDKLGGCGHLLKEMTLYKGGKKITN